MSFCTFFQFNSSILGRSGFLNESLVSSPFDTSLVAAGFGGDGGGSDVGSGGGGGGGAGEFDAARERAVNALQEENANLKWKWENAEMVHALHADKKALFDENMKLRRNLEETKLKLERMTEVIIWEMRPDESS